MRKCHKSKRDLLLGLNDFDNGMFIIYLNDNYVTWTQTEIQF